MNAKTFLRSSGDRRIEMRRAASRGYLTACGLLFVMLAGFLGCGDDNDSTRGTTEPAEEERVHGLTEAQRAEVLVKLGDKEITVGEFAEQLANQAPYMRRNFESFDRRQEFLDNLIKNEMIALEAQRRGYDSLVEVRRAQKRAMIAQLTKVVIEDAHPLESITDVELRQHYDANPEEFNKPAQVRASHILISDRATAERTLRELRAAPENMTLFRERARELNEDEHTRERFGDLRYFSRPGEPGEGDAVPREVAEAAFSLNAIGDVHAELVRTEGGFHIVKLTGRREALVRSFEEVRRPLRHELWRQRRQEAEDALVAEIRERTEVEEFPEVLSRIRLPDPVSRTPHFRSGDDDASESHADQDHADHDHANHDHGGGHAH